jgi:hypothetical protein
MARECKSGIENGLDLLFYMEVENINESVFDFKVVSLLEMLKYTNMIKICYW